MKIKPKQEANFGKEILLWKQKYATYIEIGNAITKTTIKKTIGRGDPKRYPLTATSIGSYLELPLHRFCVM